VGKSGIGTMGVPGVLVGALPIPPVGIGELVAVDSTGIGVLVGV